MFKLKFFSNNKEVLKRILITLILIMVYRLGALITMPGITIKSNAGNIDNQFLQLLSIFGGGLASKLSFFTLGVSPFITASIIMQLLGSGLIPKLSKISREGRKGQVKINYITKIVMLPLAYLQGLATIMAMENSKLIEVKWNTFDPFLGSTFYYFLCPMVLVAGTMITLLLADLISEKGIGQGTSIIIFSGILISLTYQMQKLGFLFTSQFSDNSQVFIYHLLRFFLYLLMIFLICYFVLFLNNSHRHLPIQQTGSGLRLKNIEKTYLPLKLNPSGVIPVIFASTFITIFSSISEIVKATTNQEEIQKIIVSGNEVNYYGGYVYFVENYLSFYTWSGIMIFFTFVFFFSWLYVHIVIDSEKLAENFKKNGVYILGISQGNNTQRYLSYVLIRVAFFGSLSIAFLSVFFLLFTKFLFSPEELKNISPISGTSLLILMLIGENLYKSIRDLNVQEKYLQNWKMRKDIFLW